MIYLEITSPLRKSFLKAQLLICAIYSDTLKFVPRKLYQAENFVDHLIL